MYRRRRLLQIGPASAKDKRPRPVQHFGDKRDLLLDSVRRVREVKGHGGGQVGAILCRAPVVICSNTFNSLHA